MVIGFCYKKRSIFSWLIAWTTASKWSHTFLVLRSIGNDWIFIEANFVDGVKYDLLSKYTKSWKYNVELLDLMGTGASIEHISPYFWTGHGFGQILSDAWARLWNIGYSSIKNNTVCSELVVRWARGSKRADKFIGLDLDYASPEDIYRLLKKLPHVSPFNLL